MNDEEIIRKRLLVDGDGTGDGRRINMLLKGFQKWCNSDDDTHDWKTSRDQLLSQVNQCEYAFLKSRLTASMAMSELENYKNISKQIESTIAKVREEIVGTKEEFKEAKIIRKNRIEYEVLSKVINQQPDRKETNEKLVNLTADLKNLEINFEQLEQKLDMRRKQFHVLFTSLQQLQTLLDDDVNDEKNLIDVSLEGLEDDEDMKMFVVREAMDLD